MASISSGGVDVPRIGKVRQRRGVRREITPDLVSSATSVLELAVDHAPVRYRELIASQRPSRSPSKPPSTRRPWARLLAVRGGPGSPSTPTPAKWIPGIIVIGGSPVF